MDMTCTRCRGTKFRSYCVKCDQDYAKENAALRERAEKAEAARDFLLARISEVKRDLEIGDRQDSNWDHVRAAILKCGLHDVDARKALAGKGIETMEIGWTGGKPSTPRARGSEDGSV